MNIFIDESGSFVCAPKKNAWNAICAYLSPESERKQLEAIVRKLRSKSSGNPQEVKLNDLSESSYFGFLEELSLLDGISIPIAIDLGSNPLDKINEHRAEQLSGMLAREHLIENQDFKIQVNDMIEKIKNLSSQLYVQLQCQVELVDDVIRLGTIYFVQRTPQSLGSFRWRIDQKNSSITSYEDLFRVITPAILQTEFMQEPLVLLHGADYSRFERFDISSPETTHHFEKYNIKRDEREVVADLGRLTRDNFAFVNSKASCGVQVADLIAAGVRRLLRAEFASQAKAAQLLGGVMVQHWNGMPPINFLTLDKKAPDLDQKLSDTIVSLIAHAKPMMVR